MGSYQRFPKGSAAAEAAVRRSHEWLEQQFRQAMRLPKPADTVGTEKTIRPFDSLDVAARLREPPTPTLH